MSSLPRKCVKGENFKKWTIDTLNALIDYLSSPYLQKGKGISIRRTPSGTIIELDKQPAEPKSATGGGGGASGIAATVSGGTATIALSGSDPLHVVAGSNATITGGTNGEVIISATGGGGGVTGIESSVSGGTASITLTGGTGSVNIRRGTTGGILISGNTSGNIYFESVPPAPDYEDTDQSMYINTLYGPFQTACWIVGNVSAGVTSENVLVGDLRITFYDSDEINVANPVLFDVREIPSNAGGTLCSPLYLFIPPGLSFKFTTTESATTTLSAKLYQILN